MIALREKNRGFSPEVVHRGVNIAILLQRCRRASLFLYLKGRLALRGRGGGLGSELVVRA